jgi:hypothetical protein
LIVSVLPEQPLSALLTHSAIVVPTFQRPAQAHFPLATPDFSAVFASDGSDWQRHVPGHVPAPSGHGTLAFGFIFWTQRLACPG